LNPYYPDTRKSSLSDANLPWKSEVGAGLLEADAPDLGDETGQGLIEEENTTHIAIGSVNGEVADDL